MKFKVGTLVALKLKGYDDRFNGWQNGAIFKITGESNDTFKITHEVYTEKHLYVAVRNLERYFKILTPIQLAKRRIKNEV